MPGLDPGIHVLQAGVDTRDKPAHDGSFLGGGAGASLPLIVIPAKAGMTCQGGARGPY